MIHAQSAKSAIVFEAQSVATNGTATGTVSCVGFRYAKVLLQLGTAAATNVDVTVTLTESDGTTYVTATELAMTTVAPNSSTGQLYIWYVDLKKRKKNLKVTFAPNTSVARLASCNIELSRPEQAPTSAAQHGAAAQVIA